MSRVEADAVVQRQHQRAEEARQAAQTRGVEEVVRQHYNAVPQRGREWRKTDSRIKGLRSFNNWIKSTLIHKFSPNESNDYPLRVLDVGCGKGGDLGKWQQAPQPVELYVGVDPAEISIEQAKERYAQMRSGGSRGGRGGRGGYQGGRPQRTFDAEFFAEDAFTYSLGDLPIVREIGFGPGTRWGPAGGFDVVSMMFCMHYAFETEAKAKGMLANVSGSLKKGGRFLGVIPNSDVLRSGVVAFHKRQEDSLASAPVQDSKTQRNGEMKRPGSSKTVEPESHVSISAKRKFIHPAEEEPVPKRVQNVNGNGPEEVKTAINVLTEPPSKDQPPETNGVHLNPKPKPASHTSTSPKSAPQRGTASNAAIQEAPAAPLVETAVAEWGNSIYRIRFPGDTPKDGIFRPPYGWKYNFFMEEAVEEVPEYVVPWEAFRGYALQPFPISSFRPFFLQTKKPPYAVNH